MENNEVDVRSVELQRYIQKLEKLERMINPNSKKAMILWEEDDSFKRLISDLREYALTCDTAEFPVELLDKLNALSLDATNQITLSSSKIEELKAQIKENKELSNVLSEIHLAATGTRSLESYAETLEKEAFAPAKDYLQTLATAQTDCTSNRKITS